MNIIEPSAVLWQQPSDPREGVYRHVAQCARVCRQVTNPKSDDEVLCAGLMKQNHLSMFRHCTYYFCVPTKRKDRERNKYLTNIINRAFVLHTSKNGNAHSMSRHYIAINGNAWLDLPEVMQQFLLPYRVSETEFMLGGKANTHPAANKTMPLLRTTVSVITQISTSRELNRVSPNNITEQSTRYVNFGKKGGITICKPHWYDSAPWYRKALARIGWQLSEWEYLLALRMGMKPQDAREFLPLCTATQCIYTYSNKEWNHLFDLRIDGTTGVPHPNAKIAASLIKEQVEIHNRSLSPLTLSPEREREPICTTR